MSVMLILSIVCHKHKVFSVLPLNLVMIIGTKVTFLVNTFDRRNGLNHKTVIMVRKVPTGSVTRD